MNDPSTVYNTTDGILEPLVEIEEVLKQMYVSPLVCPVELMYSLWMYCCSQAGKFLFLAAFTILFWDHACTLPDEVRIYFLLGTPSNAQVTCLAIST